MDDLLWVLVGWAALSVLATPVLVRLCRCMARFDPPREQLAAAAAGAETTLAPPGRTLLVERRSGVDRRHHGQDAPGRRRSDAVFLLG